VLLRQQRERTDAAERQRDRALAVVKRQLAACDQKDAELGTVRADVGRLRERAGVLEAELRAAREQRALGEAGAAAAESEKRQSLGEAAEAKATAGRLERQRIALQRSLDEANEAAA